jgi:hypothetical protein
MKNLAPFVSMMYSFGDGAGGTELDTDWYTYSGTAGNIFYVNVNLLPDPDASDLESGELFLEPRILDYKY